MIRIAYLLPLLALTTPLAAHAQEYSYQQNDGEWQTVTTQTSAPVTYQTVTTQQYVQPGTTYVTQPVYAAQPAYYAPPPYYGGYGYGGGVPISIGLGFGFGGGHGGGGWRR